MKKKQESKVLLAVATRAVSVGEKNLLNEFGLHTYCIESTIPSEYPFRLWPPEWSKPRLFHPLEK
jgi:hypothetical protein